MVDFGYDVSDFKDIDNGTLVDFENLIKQTKKVELKIIKDKTNWYCIKNIYLYYIYFKTFQLSINFVKF